MDHKDIYQYLENKGWVEQWRDSYDRWYRYNKNHVTIHVQKREQKVLFNTGWLIDYKEDKQSFGFNVTVSFKDFKKAFKKINRLFKKVGQTIGQNKLE